MSEIVKTVEYREAANEPLISIRPFVICVDDMHKPPLERRFLLGRRAEGHEQAGMWEVMGGKPERNPDDKQPNPFGREFGLTAGGRELREEAGLIVIPQCPLEKVDGRQIPDGPYRGRWQDIFGYIGFASFDAKFYRSPEVDRVVWATYPQALQLAGGMTETGLMVINHFWDRDLLQ